MPGRMPTSPPPQWLPAGTCIGHYRVEQLISSGGFGVVYRVSRDGQQFALKLPLPQPPAPADERPRGELADHGGHAQPGAGNENEAEDHRALEQRIVREVVSLMTLNHPNIVRVHGFDRWPSPTSGALYLVMDFVEGVPLLQWRRNERPTVREVVRLFQTLALALDLMHRLGVVHRDLKSTNVLVAPRKDNEEAAAWKPVLVDFGLARPAFTTDVTREYVLVGTAGLYAPSARRLCRSGLHRRRPRPLQVRSGHRPACPRAALLPGAHRDPRPRHQLERLHCGADRGATRDRPGRGGLRERAPNVLPKGPFTEPRSAPVGRQASEWGKAGESHAAGRVRAAGEARRRELQLIVVV